MLPMRSRLRPSRLHPTRSPPSGLTRKRDLQDFVSKFPDRSFSEPTDQERISLSQATAAARTVLNGIPDKEAEVSHETVKAVLDCLKIDHEIKWVLTSGTNPEDEFTREWTTYHNNCPGGNECAERSREAAEKYVGMWGKPGSKLHMTRKK